MRARPLTTVQNHANWSVKSTQWNLRALWWITWNTSNTSNLHLLFTWDDSSSSLDDYKQITYNGLPALHLSIKTTHLYKLSQLSTGMDAIGRATIWWLVSEVILRKSVNNLKFWTICEVQTHTCCMSAYDIKPRPHRRLRQSRTAVHMTASACVDSFVARNKPCVDDVRATKQHAPLPQAPVWTRLKSMRLRVSSAKNRGRWNLELYDEYMSTDRVTKSIL